MFPSVAYLFLVIGGVAVDAASHSKPFEPSHWPVETAEPAGYPYDVPYGGWQPGGSERRIGSPYFWSVPRSTVPLATYGYGSAGIETYAPAFDRANPSLPHHWSVAAELPPPAGASDGPATDPYSFHFGPGLYRSAEFGHVRFPYYSYRRPWYDVGHPIYVRDTNVPW